MRNFKKRVVVAAVLSALSTGVWAAAGDVMVDDGAGTPTPSTVNIDGANNVTGVNTLNSTTINNTGAATIGGNLDANGSLNVIGVLGVSENRLLGESNAAVGNFTALSGNGENFVAVRDSNVRMVSQDTGSNIQHAATVSNVRSSMSTIDVTSSLVRNVVTNLAGVTINSTTDGTAGSTILVRDTSASMLVTNSLGNTHGLTITGSSTTLSGGTTSTTLTLNDAGASFDNNLSVTGNITATGNGSFGGTLGVTGATTLGSTLAVTGATTLGSTLGVTGATTLGSTLGVTGATTLGSTLSVAGNTTLSGTTNVIGVAGVSTNTINGLANNINGSTTITSADGNNTAMVNNGGVFLNANLPGQAATSGAVNVTGTTASVTVTNALGNTHGLNVGTAATTLSGGTASTTLTLNDAGATFSGTGGVPARVMGVANGVMANDAVNVSQLNGVARRAYGGVASVAALAGIPDPMPGKDFSIGVGYGRYIGEDAMAIGFKANISDRWRFNAGVGLSHNHSTTSVGLGFSW